MGLKCKNCNGDLLINRDRTMLKCPYCGTKYLIKESDAVKIQKIQSQTQKDIELSRQRHEAQKEKLKIEQEKRRIQKAEIEAFKKSKFAKILIVFTIISVLVCLLELSSGICLSGIIALVQAILYLTAWFMGMQIIKAKIPNLHILVFIASLLLIIPFFIFFTDTPDALIDQPEEFLWADIEMYEYLPEPDKIYGNIGSNSDSSLGITLNKVSKEDFNEYVDTCIATGYQIESEKSDSSYTAYNSEGYKLRLHLYSYDDENEMSIHLDAPEEMKEFEWPTQGIATLIPCTKSNLGRVTWDNSETYIVHVGNTTIDEYSEYVKSCEAVGFTVNYSRTDEYYSALNAEGYELTLRYEGFNTIGVALKAPDEKSEHSAKVEISSIEKESSVNENGTNDFSLSDVLENLKGLIPDKTIPSDNDSIAGTTASSGALTGVRPEFKETMDSYELFFDEYISFMTKYTDSGNPATMLIDYGKYMLQVKDTMKKMEALGDDDLNDAELLYYIEVTSRIYTKLAAID